MKLVFLDRKTLGEDIDLSNFSNFGEVIFHESTAYDQTLERVKDADVVITNKVVIDKTIMEQSNIKLICITATGTNNVDLEYAQQNNIPVKNVAGYSTASVAQVTFALAMELIQKTSYYANFGQNGEWEKSGLFTHIDKPFFELEGKSWGIIGLGTIGQKVAQIATGFGCNVNYYSTSGANNNTNYNSQTLEELLKTNDIISIHAPLNEKTQDLINAQNLPCLKKGAVLINVGRGGIINEKDLAHALDNQNLLCGLDVVEKEPIVKENPLNFIQNKENLIITPHIAWASVEARTRLMKSVYENIQEYLTQKQ